MADFQSSKTAQEIETVLTGAVLFNTYTKLSETQKAQARANIGATANGEGIKIISHFDTLEELEAAVKSPNAGDAYSVGSNLPYNLYIYDFLSAEWRDYGAIRSTDISARFAQNVAVDVSAWKEDTDVFVDFSYKAQIPLGEVTGNDFPVVAFAPSDAVSGNYCPIAYCFDGYVEVWARAIPATAISIPAITFIIQDDGASGGSTKGITNASGGIATGGIGSEQIADGSMTTPKYANASVTRAKLAPDALYSPFTIFSSGDTVNVNHIGKKLRDGNSTAYILNVAADSNIPNGAELAVFRLWSTSLKIVFGSGTRVALKGGTGFLTAPTLAVPEKYTTIALEKVMKYDGYDIWHVLGDVEVVE